VYVSQIAGAWLGDRLVSPRRLVLWGGVVIAVGHVALALLPGFAGLGIGLALVVAGTGALKTNITSIVGHTLEGDDLRRDAGFSYFYMAINVGAVVGPLATGLLQSLAGFHVGFGLAAVGMVVALVVYVSSMRSLPERASVVANPIEHRRLVVPAVGVVVVGALIAVAVVTRALNELNLVAVVTAVAVLAAAAYFALMLSSRTITHDERRRVLGYLPLFVVSGIYFGFLFQKFTAISILIDERVDRALGDWEFPVAWVTTVSPLAAVLVTPFIARLWDRLGDRQPSQAAKVGIGLTQIGVAYLVLLIIAETTGEAPLPLVLILLFMAIAGSSEVFVGPIGLSMASRIGPARLQSQMVGLNFLTLALGSSLSGLLGQLFTVLPNGVYFTIVAAGGIVLGAAILAASGRLDRLLRSGLD